MSRQALIECLTSKSRYSFSSSAPLLPLRGGRYIFAATDENAGYFLLTDEKGQVLPLTEDTYADIVDDAKLMGVKLRNFRVFGASGGLKRAPGVRFYPIDSIVSKLRKAVSIETGALTSGASAFC